DSVEDYPLGYPRFSAFLASQASFHLCRRFSNLRARLLLLKQDRLTALEEQLEELDREDTGTLTLGCSRTDGNERRSSVLSEISNAMEDYDVFLERHWRIMSFEAALHRAVLNVQNWLSRSACMARKVTAYLYCGEDLLSTSTPENSFIAWLEELAEDSRVCLYERFRKVRLYAQGQSLVVHIFSSSSMRRIARILMTPIITFLLPAPVVIYSFVSSLTIRLVVVVAATTGFIALLSSFTRARTVELVVAGATYTTVLVVFISSTNGPVAALKASPKNWPHCMQMPAFLPLLTQMPVFLPYAQKQNSKRANWVTAPNSNPVAQDTHPLSNCLQFGKRNLTIAPS
ncbi:hypothetical protein B0T24DRAFT_534247, partial [Lasiosphaeria ovina]